jgi:hypothetical protein
MPFEWRQFLEVARYLKAQIDTVPFTAESGFRTAIGRAYYAAFGHALAYAKANLGFRGKSKAEEKSQEHGLKAHLRLKKRAKVAYKLDQLRILRNLCDYEELLEGFPFQENLDAALDDADYIFQSLIPPQ